MKKKILLLILLLFIIPIVTKAIEYDKTIDTKIDNIISYKEGYIELIDNTLYSYINNELISTKQFTDLNKLNIIELNNNFLIVGIKNNTIKTYLIDNKLKVLSNKETSYIITNGLPYLYKYDNKIYTLFINDGILTTNNIYIIDENLDISETKLSNITNIKEIIKSDYYILNNSGNIIDNNTYYYNKSTYLNDNSIIVGYKENELLEKNAIINFIDKEGYVLWQDDNPDYYNYKDVTILENTIYLLATNNIESFIIKYDYTGKKLEQEKISNDLPICFSKVSNNLYILTENNQLIYKYNISINKENDIYGELKINGEPIPYSTIKLEVLPNSGYQLDSYEIKDEQGNNIEVIDNSFIMPDSSITIKVNYKETVINPETVDMIFIVLAICSISLIVFTKTYKQYKWLKG